MKNRKYSKPFISIIVPTRNEEKYIQKCLESFVSQDYPEDKFEILIVDGCSEDKTVSIVNEFIKIHSNIFLFRNDKKTTPIALNIGVKNAKGDFIIIFSGHGFAEQDFILENVKTHTMITADCVGGTISTIGDNVQSKVISLAQSSIFGVGNSLFRISKKAQYVDTVAFGAYKKEVFDKIGLFDEILIRNQDFEFNHRIIKNGGKIYLSPNIKSSYYARSSIFKLLKQYFQYGYWKVKVLAKHSDGFRIRYLIPPTFLLTMIILAGLSLVNSFYLNLFCIFLTSYLVVILYASITISLKSNLLYFIILPFAFIGLHFGFGSGILIGMFKQMSKIITSSITLQRNK